MRRGKSTLLSVCVHYRISNYILYSGLTLVKAPHLARSYYHLFPLPAFTETLCEMLVCDYGVVFLTLVVMFYSLSALTYVCMCAYDCVSFSAQAGAYVLAVRVP